MTLSCQSSIVNIGQLWQGGYPEWIQHEGRLIALLPWHERELEQKVYGFSRQMVQKHLRAQFQSESPVYGMYIDADSGQQKEQPLVTFL